MAVRTLQSSFTGEVSPSMYGRIDNDKYKSGLAVCRNFVCLPQGPVQNRSGFAFVRQTKYADKPARLIAFEFSSTDTMILEFGHQYLRFHSRGGTLLNANGMPYEISTPYSSDDIFVIHYAQSADVMTLVHPHYPVKELRRYGAYDWRLIDVTFSAPLSPPGNVSVEYVPNGNESDSRFTYKYKVTAVQDSDEGQRESAPSEAASVSCNLWWDNALNRITWSAVAGAARYRVYKSTAGVFGYIGETEGTSFEDNRVDADDGITPPRYDAMFGEGDYPSAVAYFEQRRCFAGTVKRPQFVWMTRSGTETDMAYHIPVTDDDRIKFKIAAQKVSRLKHLAPLSQLLALSESAIFRLSPANSDVITPESVSAKPQVYQGASEVQPLLIRSNLIYASERGGHVIEMGYNWQQGGFAVNDLCVFAPHLFERARVKDMALALSPHPIIWCAMTDGCLLGLTYMPEQAVSAWHRHDTINGAFESVAVVPEGDEDILYAVVRRTINGATVRFIERMHERLYDGLENCFHVDAGSTYEGEETQTLSGLDYLEGCEVAILADGAVLPREKVKNGQITLEVPAKKIQVGLPVISEIQTLPLIVNLQDGSFGRGHQKNINRVWMQVYQSSGIFVGPSFDDLTEVKQRLDEPYGEPPEPLSTEIDVPLPGSWNASGQLVLRQKDPLPLTLVGITCDLAQ